MGAVTVGAVLFAILLIVVAAMVWQEAKRRPGAPPVYLLDEATRFAYERISDEAASRIDLDDVSRILEWGMRWNQVVARRQEGPVTVIGSDAAAEYIVEQAAARHGILYDRSDVGEVLVAEAGYLEAIGAVGGMATGDLAGGDLG